MITYKCMPDARIWDGQSYDRISGPMEALGREVLGRLDLHGDETVLDAGCGSGRITQALIDRLPNGRVIAVNASPSMVSVAKERLGAQADVRVADLLELELDEHVDPILSTATFHWVLNHDVLFRRLHAAMRPGGQLVAQCGERATSHTCVAGRTRSSPAIRTRSVSPVSSRRGTTPA